MRSGARLGLAHPVVNGGSALECANPLCVRAVFSAMSPSLDRGRTRLLTMLHEVTAEGGLGFCADALPELLAPEYHGPLAVALDSNILIDLREHGTALLNGEQLNTTPADYAEELHALGALIDLWLIRDIRFLVTPRSLTDAKRMTERFIQTRIPAVEGIAEALAFQSGDWVNPAPSYDAVPPFPGEESGLPDNADRRLILEAQAFGAHVFLTRDREVLEKTQLNGPRLAVASPITVMTSLENAGVTHFGGGTCEKNECPYREHDLPAPDFGKWAPLMGLFDS